MDLTRRELRTHGVPVPLGNRAFDIVEVLARSAGELVTKDEIMRRVWSGTIVEENALQVHISAIRKALGPDRGMLKTAFGRGYRLLGAWTIRQERISAAPVVLEIVPPTEFLTNFPSASSELIGRTGAVRHLGDLLSAYRVVTLTGPGGIGKSALALAVARSLFPLFQGDGWLVELASLSDPELVPSAVASVLDLKLGGDEISAEAVARIIGDKKLFLILDNCEHVIDAAAELAEAVVHLCPRTTVLATSREVLRIDGEYVYRVPPLDVPPEDHMEPEVILEHNAVELFIARTRTQDPDISLHGEDLQAIASICRHLDGIPLAIEFAAARAATLGLEHVASNLDDRFTLLTSGRRTALPRHRTLRAMLDWSYELLPETERKLFRRLAVFSAGFTLEAAAAVVGDSTAPAVAESLANLVAKSLVTRDGFVPAGRWRLLETIRSYGLGRLTESGDAEQVRRKCAEFFRDLFVRVTPSSFPERSRAEMVQYAREIDNVRASLDWCFSPSGDSGIGFALTAAYAPVWLNLSLTAELRERGERALEELNPALNLDTRLRMHLQIALGISLIVTLGSVERTRSVLTGALELAEGLNDLDAQARTSWALWALHFNTGECRVAHSAAERFLGIALSADDPAVVPVAHRCMGYTLQYSGNQRESRRSLERAVGFYMDGQGRRQMLWPFYDPHVLARATLARSLWLQGFLQQAETAAQGCLADAQATNDKLTLCFVLALAVSPIALFTGDLVTAQRSVAALVDVATRQSFTQYKRVACALDGMLLIQRREFVAGTALLSDVLETGERTGWAADAPTYRGTLAQGFAGLGQIAQALATVDEALASANRGGECWYVAELLRIKGELLVEEATAQSVSAAEDCFVAAIDVAQEQGALSWELRAATSLARLRYDQTRCAEASALLQPVYDRFTEGFDTADLKAAKAFLDSLP
ncbi:MAG TPA: winged helix-turn-helix domain-containing protein [Candidatus Dormibacteraeota bacterium]|nr:winged helix-turn-helix domain-containing protein [Candidatus Dormibacteraeota bacterium]